MQSSGEARSLEELNELVEAQQILIDQLRSRIDEFRGTLSRSNSSDGKGHADVSPVQNVAELEGLDPVPDPDEIVVLVPHLCAACGDDLSEAKVVGAEQRQVIDVPQIRVRVTEYVAERRLCANGHESKSPFPEFARGLISYGPGMRALAKYLSLHQHIPLDRTSEIFSDVLGSDISLDNLAKIVADGQGPENNSSPQR
jgi:transposase